PNSIVTLPQLSSCSSYTLLPPSALYTLSLHDALPILAAGRLNVTVTLTYLEHGRQRAGEFTLRPEVARWLGEQLIALANGMLSADRKSTRLNSSHVSSSYAVFCLKKKNPNQKCHGRYR